MEDDYDKIFCMEEESELERERGNGSESSSSSIEFDIGTPHVYSHEDCEIETNEEAKTEQRENSLIDLLSKLSQQKSEVKIAKEGDVIMKDLLQKYKSREKTLIKDKIMILRETIQKFRTIWKAPYMCGLSDVIINELTLIKTILKEQFEILKLDEIVVDDERESEFSISITNHIEETFKNYSKENVKQRITSCPFNTEDDLILKIRLQYSFWILIKMRLQQVDKFPLTIRTIDKLIRLVEEHSFIFDSPIASVINDILTKNGLIEEENYKQSLEEFELEEIGNIVKAYGEENVVYINPQVLLTQQYKAFIDNNPSLINFQTDIINSSYGYYGVFNDSRGKLLSIEGESGSGKSIFFNKHFLKYFGAFYFKDSKGFVHNSQCFFGKHPFNMLSDTSAVVSLQNSDSQNNCMHDVARTLINLSDSDDLDVKNRNTIGLTAQLKYNDISYLTTSPTLREFNTSNDYNFFTQYNLSLPLVFPTLVTTNIGIEFYSSDHPYKKRTVVSIVMRNRIIPLWEKCVKYTSSYTVIDVYNILHFLKKSEYTINYMTHSSRNLHILNKCLHLLLGSTDSPYFLTIKDLQLDLTPSKNCPRNKYIETSDGKYAFSFENDCLNLKILKWDKLLDYDGYSYVGLDKFRTHDKILKVPLQFFVSLNEFPQMIIPTKTNPDFFHLCLWARSIHNQAWKLLPKGMELI